MHRLANAKPKKYKTFYLIFFLIIIGRNVDLSLSHITAQEKLYSELAFRTFSVIALSCISIMLSMSLSSLLVLCTYISHFTGALYTSKSEDKYCQNIAVTKIFL